MAAILYSDTGIVKEFLRALGVNTATCRECKILFTAGEPVIVEMQHYADLEDAVESLRTRRFRLVEEIHD